MTRGRGIRDEHYAKLHPFEERCLSLWSDGLSMEEIAAHIGSTNENVGKALGIATGGTEHLKFAARARRGTDMLGKAIMAYHARRVA
jgi:hypothetical protein